MPGGDRGVTGRQGATLQRSAIGAIVRPRLAWAFANWPIVVVSLAGVIAGLGRHVARRDGSKGWARGPTTWASSSR